MVNERSSQAQEAIQKARRALKADDKKSAYSWAKRAAQLDPKSEDSWLILAAVSKPEQSIKFLRRALQLNPNSQRAQKGMAWAERKMAPVQKKVIVPKPAQSPRAKRAQPSPPPEKKKNRLSLVLLGGFLLICLVGSIFLAFNASPVMALFGNAPTATIFVTEQHWAEGTIAKPSYTPSPTSTATPTQTFTSTPSFTATPTFTATNTRTFTPTKTLTPTITNTPSPTNTFAPTNTPKPVSTLPPVAEGVHWIDVNLTEQRVYAYAGNTLINSFLVSTGTWETPTVTGQYNIYLKYRSTSMSGPGYSLSDVPYAMYFYKGYGFHGTYWHSNFGTPMSHGCVNMLTSEAGWLYDFAPIGTLVNIHY